MATFAVTLDNGSVITFEGNLTGDLQGLPTGWTQDNSDPANVTSNDGALDLGNGALNVGGTASLSGQTNLTGATVYVTNLPTVDPADAGRLWNDTGTVKVSAG